MKVAVTGASGHVGANLVRELVPSSESVRALVFHDHRALDGVDVERISGDVLDMDSLRRAFEGVDLVYHLAAHIAVSHRERELVQAVNVQGTTNVVQACLDGGVKRLVHVSSTHACCPWPADQAIDENRPLADTMPCLDYDRSKAQGERAVLGGVDCGLDAVIACPSGILGPYDFKPSLMGETLLALYRGRFPALVGGGYDWVDVRDVVTSLMTLATRGRRGERYLLTGHWLSVVDLAGLVGEVTGRKMPRLTAPLSLAAWGAPFAERVVSLVGKRPLFTKESIQILGSNGSFCHDKATHEIGHEPRPLRDTIEATFRWFRQAGMA
jgi:dihydroflavonol-4-reductase